jgi:protein N-terminal amidase
MGSSRFGAICGSISEPSLDFIFLGIGFRKLDMPSSFPLPSLTLAICMDLNPKPPAHWTSMEGPYELAWFAKRNETRIVVLLCAWVDSKEGEIDGWDLGTVRYWMARFRPLWQKEDGDVDEGGETIVIICNRTGEERGSRSFSWQARNR